MIPPPPPPMVKRTNAPPIRRRSEMPAVLVKFGFIIFCAIDLVLVIIIFGAAMGRASKIQSFYSTFHESCVKVAAELPKTRIEKDSAPCANASQTGCYVTRIVKIGKDTTPSHEYEDRFGNKVSYDKHGCATKSQPSPVWESVLFGFTLVSFICAILSILMGQSSMMLAWILLTVGVILPKILYSLYPFPLGFGFQSVGFHIMNMEQLCKLDDEKPGDYKTYIKFRLKTFLDDNDISDLDPDTEKKIVDKFHMPGRPIPDLPRQFLRLQFTVWFFTLILVMLRLVFIAVAYRIYKIMVTTEIQEEMQKNQLESDYTIPNNNAILVTPAQPPIPIGQKSIRSPHQSIKEAKSMVNKSVSTV